MNVFITVVDKMYDFLKLFVTYNIEVENFDRIKFPNVHGVAS